MAASYWFFLKNLWDNSVTNNFRDGSSWFMIYDQYIYMMYMIYDNHLGEIGYASCRFDQVTSEVNDALIV